jgi:hypothetical protein
MGENEMNEAAKNGAKEGSELTAEDFVLNPISSAETIKRAEPPVFLNEEKSGADEITTETDERANDPIFAALAAPRLPELDRENRARLLMQTPTRLYFYWSVKNNPFQILRKAFGGNVGSYQLIVRLVNQTRRREELHPVEAEGNWWFNVEANSLYRAEIGFYAPNRPFVRIMFSNTVETPRKSPSPRPATESEWAVTSAQFAEILDDSAFQPTLSRSRSRATTKKLPKFRRATLSSNYSVGKVLISGLISMPKKFVLRCSRSPRASQSKICAVKSATRCSPLCRKMLPT